MPKFSLWGWSRYVLHEIRTMEKNKDMGKQREIQELARGITTVDVILQP
jgi:hypothetical protein